MVQWQKGTSPIAYPRDNKSKSKTFEYEKNLFVGRGGFAHTEASEEAH